MKPKHIFILILLFLSGCITDEKVTTYFHPDGTVTRRVTFKTNRKKFDTDHLAVPVDSSWTLTVRKDTADTAQFLVRAEKTFGGVQWLNNDYKIKPNALSGVKREISFERKFMWFYTFYYYQETVSKVFDQHPLSEFLTDEEIGYVKAGDPKKKEMVTGLDSMAREKYEDRVNKKYMQWLAACMFDELLAGLTKTAQTHPAGAFTVKNLTSGKDSLKAKYTGMIVNMKSDKVFSQYFSDCYGVVPDSLMDRYPAYFKRYVELQNIFSSVFFAEYENRVQLPGRLYDSNADTVEKDLCSWQVRPARYLGDDLDMFAAAREANLWAWAVALVILVLTLAVWLVPKKKEEEKAKK
ncbi:MAG: hypothetical protein J7K46_10065 [Bacteroidales bacterium]|nr:hypothetical protein [Bacteroidales bacterium]